MREVVSVGVLVVGESRRVVVSSSSASSMVCSTSVKDGYWAVTHRSSA